MINQSHSDKCIKIDYKLKINEPSKYFKVLSRCLIHRLFNVTYEPEKRKLYMNCEYVE